MTVLILALFLTAVSIIIVRFLVVPRILRHMLYIGRVLPFDRCAEYSEVEHQDSFVCSDEQRNIMINTVFFPTKSVVGSLSSPTILILHANFTNLSCLPDNFDEFIRFANIVTMDYRGYGLSTRGKFSEEGIVDDAYAVLKSLSSRSDIDPYNIHLYGISLGAAVAIGVVSKIDAERNNENRQQPMSIPIVRSVILVNAFTSMKSLVFDRYFGYNIKLWSEYNPSNATFRIVWSVIGTAFVFLLVPDLWSSITRISSTAFSKSSIKVLFISGVRDTVTPPIRMIELKKACSADKRNKEIIFIQNGDHNDTHNQLGFSNRVKTFIGNS